MQRGGGGKGILVSDNSIQAGQHRIMPALACKCSRCTLVLELTIALHRLAVVILRALTVAFNFGIII